MKRTSQSYRQGTALSLQSKSGTALSLSAKTSSPRHRRLDLVNTMPTGEQKRIARVLKCSRGFVSSVLNGRRSADTDLGRNIIRLAEHAAAMEAGKRYIRTNH